MIQLLKSYSYYQFTKKCILGCQFGGNTFQYGISLKLNYLVVFVLTLLTWDSLFTCPIFPLNVLHSINPFVLLFIFFLNVYSRGVYCLGCLIKYYHCGFLLSGGLTYVSNVDSFILRSFRTFIHLYEITS